MTLNGKLLNHLEKNKNYILQFAIQASLYVTAQSRANAGVALLFIYINILDIDRGWKRKKVFGKIPDLLNIYTYFKWFFFSNKWRKVRLCVALKVDIANIRTLIE